MYSSKCNAGLLSRQIEVHLSFSFCLFRPFTLTILFLTPTNPPPVAYFGSHFARNAQTHERRIEGREKFRIDSTNSLIYRGTSDRSMHFTEAKELDANRFSFAVRPYTHERRDSKRANAKVHPRDSFAATYVHCNHAHTSISVLTRFLFGRFFRSLTSESRIISANLRRVRSSLTEISSSPLTARVGSLKFPRSRCSNFAVVNARAYYR